MGKINWRDLARGVLVGLIAGVGYLIAYLVVLQCTINTPYFEQMRSQAWLWTIPVPAALLYSFSKRMRPDEPLEPVAPVTSGAEDEPAESEISPED